MCPAGKYYWIFTNYPVTPVLTHYMHAYSHTCIQWQSQAAVRGRNKGQKLVRRFLKIRHFVGY